MSRLSKLTTLNLQRNKLSALPEWIKVRRCLRGVLRLSASSSDF
jgi:hypothetical protein